MRGVAPLLFVILAGCGDPLAEGDFAGDAKLKVQAIVCGETETATPPTNPRFGVFWKWYEAGQSRFVVNEVSTLSSPGFPALVELEVFDAPPTLAPTVVAGAAGAHGIDLGCPVLFDDLDDDGTYSEADLLLAVSLNELLVFYRGADGGSSLTGDVRLDNVGEEQSFGLVKGICNEQGLPSGELQPTANDHPLDVRFLNASAAEQTCIRFF